MAWTNPNNFPIGHLVTPNDMNVYHRDNLNYLYDIVGADTTHDYYYRSATQSTTSTTFQRLVRRTTGQPKAGNNPARWLLSISVEFFTTGGSWGVYELRLSSDPASEPADVRINQNAANVSNRLCFTSYAESNGPLTYAFWFRRVTSSSNIPTGRVQDYSIFVQELA